MQNAAAVIPGIVEGAEITLQYVVKVQGKTVGIWDNEFTACGQASVEKGIVKVYEVMNGNAIVGIYTLTDFAERWREEI